MEDGQAKKAASYTRDQLVGALDTHLGIIRYFLLLELDRILEELKLEKIETSDLSYIASLSTLALCGRDIDKGEVTKLLVSVGIEPDDRMLDRFVAFRIKNYLVYVNCLFYLLDTGTEPSVEALVKTARALDIYPDVRLATLVIDFYRKKYGQPDALGI